MAARSAVASATSPTGQPLAYEWVPIGEMFRPEGLQRPMDEAHVQRIVDKFNEAAFGTPVLSYRSPGRRGPRGQTYAIVSGQHRIEAARRLNRTTLYCAVAHDLDEAAEARLYIDEDARKRQSVIRKFHLARQSGDPEALAIWDILTTKGYVIPKSKSHHPHNGDLLCIAAIYRAFRAGVLPGTLDVLTAAFGREPGAMRAEIVAGVSSVLWRRGDAVDTARLSARLRDIGSKALMLRFRAAQEVARREAWIVMANIMIGVYNSRLRAENVVESITHAETQMLSGRASAKARHAKMAVVR